MFLKVLRFLSEVLTENDGRKTRDEPID